MLNTAFRGNNIQIPLEKLRYNDDRELLFKEMGKVSGFNFYSKELEIEKSPNWLILELPVLIENRRQKGHIISDLSFNKDLGVLFFQESEVIRMDDILGADKGYRSIFSVLWGMQGDRYEDYQLKKYKSKVGDTRPVKFANIFRVVVNYIYGGGYSDFEQHHLDYCGNINENTALDEKIIKARQLRFKLSKERYSLEDLNVLKNRMIENYTRNLYDGVQRNKIHRNTVNFVYGLYTYVNAI